MKTKKVLGKARAKVALTTAFATTAAFVGIVGASPAMANSNPQDHSLSLDYKCIYPMIGQKTVHVDMTVQQIPGIITPNTVVNPLNITATAKIGDDTTPGLYAINASTIEGGVRAGAVLIDGDHPADNPLAVAVGPLTVPKTNVPETGGFPVGPVTGSTPQLQFTNTGWGQINVGDLTMQITPKDSAGNPTALGTLQVNCYQLPNQNNLLVQAYIGDASQAGSPPPAIPWSPAQLPDDYPASSQAPVTTGTKTSPLTYTCVYPSTGPHKLSVKATVSFPATANNGEYQPQIAIHADASTDSDTTGALQTSGVDHFDGQAVANATLTAPEVATPLGVRVKMPVARTNVSTDSNNPPPTTLSTDGKAPSLVFSKAGTGTMTVNDMLLMIHPYDNNDTIVDSLVNNPDGYMHAPCTLDTTPAQDSTIATFQINPKALQPAKLGAVATNLANTSVPTTARLVWSAVPRATSYDLYDGATLVKTVNPPPSTSATDTIRYSAANLTNGTHKFTVVAKNGADPNSAPSNEVDVTVGGTPPPPQKLAAPAISADSTTSQTPTLSWAAVPNATGYDVYDGTTKLTSVTGTSYQPSTPLTIGQTYKFTVRATDGTAADTSDPSNEVDVTPASTKPAAPVISVDNTMSATPTLSWAAVTGATGYEVDQDGVKIATVTDLKYTVSPALAVGKTYKFTVKTIAGSAVSDPSNEVAVTPMSMQLAAPVVTADSTSSATPTLSWAAVDRATGYDVYDGATKLTSVTGTSAKLTLSCGKSYKLTVVATDGTAADNSPPSNEVDVNTPACVLAAPVISIDSATSATPTLTWAAVPNATGYEVDQDGVKIASVTDTKYTVSPALAGGKTYKFTVKATDGNAADTSAPSNEVSTTVALPPLAAPTIKVDDNTSATPTLSWAAVDRATGYDVYQDGTKITSVAGTSYQVTGLKSGVTYKFTVKATDGNASETSPFSNEVSVTPKTVVNPLSAPVIAADSTASTTPTLSWAAVDRATGYDVYQDGTKVTSVTGTSYKVSPALADGKSYVFTVKATGANPAETSAASNAVTVTPVVPLAAPVLKIDNSQSATPTLTWGAVDRATGYDVYQNGTKVTSLNGSTLKYQPTGLQAGQTYKFTLNATNGRADETSPSSNEVSDTVPSGGPGTHFSWTIKGSSAIKAANGTVPLAGTITGDLDGSGNFTADLSLANTTGAFNVLGFLPVTANISFVPQGKTSGSVSGSTLSADSKVLVKVPSVKVFGFEVGGGSTCQTTSPADVPLKSTDFNQTTGGTLSGTYTLPGLTGCGALTPLISAITAGPGNTVTLKLTPAASTPATLRTTAKHAK